MTKQEVCRLISEKLEPKPVYKPAWRINDVAVDIHGQRSKMGFWKYSYGEGWIPVDYFEDEDASAKLFDFIRKGDSTGMRKAYFRLLLERLLFTNDDRKSVVVEYAMWQLDIEGGVE